MPPRPGNVSSDMMWLAAATAAAFFLSSSHGPLPPVTLPEPIRQYAIQGAVMLLAALLFHGNRRIRELTASRRELKQTLRTLAAIIDELKVLNGILPICSFCKNIRNDEGDWEQVEVYIQQNTEADCSHSICPTCLERHYPEYYAASLRQTGID